MTEQINTETPRQRIDPFGLIANEKFDDLMCYKINFVKKLIDQTKISGENTSQNLDHIIEDFEKHTNDLTLFNKIPKNIKMEDFNSDEFLKKIRNQHSIKKLSIY